MTYIAKPFVAGTPEAKVVGQVVLAFSENLTAERIAHLLPKHGLDNIDPEAWYPHQSWMDVLKDVEEEAKDADTSFVAFGRKVVETAVMPPEMKTLEDALQALHAIHHLNLRNIPEDEGYHLEKLADKHYLVHHNTPNPEAVIYGFLWGMAARFVGAAESFSLKRRPDIQSGKGRDVYEVRWGIGV